VTHNQGQKLKKMKKLRTVLAKYSYRTRYNVYIANKVDSRPLILAIVSPAVFRE